MLGDRLERSLHWLTKKAIIEFLERKAARFIQANPGIGARLQGREDCEHSTPFGQRGPILRHRIAEDMIVILIVWHRREARDG